MNDSPEIVTLKRVTTGSICIFWDVVYKGSRVGFLTYHRKTEKFQWQEAGYKHAEVKDINEIGNRAINNARDEIANDAIDEMLGDT